MRDNGQQVTPHRSSLLPRESYTLAFIVPEGSKRYRSTLSYVVVENRSKLKPSSPGFHSRNFGPKRMEEITVNLDVPLVYSGDTEMNPSLASTTFAIQKLSFAVYYSDEHADRASVGKHIHIKR